MNELNADIKKQINEYIFNQVDEYFKRGTGGNNRQWVNRYQEMVKMGDFVLSSNAFSDEYKEGYRHAMDCFLKIGKRK